VTNAHVQSNRNSVKVNVKLAMERTERDTARRPTETDYIAIQKGRGYVTMFMLLEIISTPA